MKGILYSTIFFCLNLSSQNLPYFNQSSSWFHNGASVDLFGGYYVNHHVNYVDADTVINSLSYLKVYQDRQDTSWRNGQLFHIDSLRHKYFFALREDLGEVFRIYNGATTEMLVYNYNISLGQRLWMQSCADSATVIRIDTVPFAGSTRFVFVLNKGVYPQNIIIEGVGSAAGIDVGCPYYFGIEGNYLLDCYQMNGDMLGFTNDCPSRYLNIKELKENLGVSLHPNPAINQLTINLGSLPVEQVNVYNVDGKLLSQTKQPADNTIDVSSFTKGVYVAEIRVGEAFQRVRWVKL